MILRYHNEFDGQPILAQVHGSRVSIGRNRDNDIPLDNQFIDQHAVELVRQDDNHWTVICRGDNGCVVNDRQLEAAQSVVWDLSGKLQLFPYVFVFQHLPKEVVEETRRYEQEAHLLVRRVHLDLLRHLELKAHLDDVPRTTEALVQLERSIESSAVSQGMVTGTAYELAGQCVRDAILEALVDQGQDTHSASRERPDPWAALATKVPDMEDTLQQWVASCLGRLATNVSNADINARMDRVERGFWPLWDTISPQMPMTVAKYLADRHLKKLVKDTLFGFGPLEDLLRLPTVNEIMVNACDEIFIEKNNILQKSGRTFLSDEVLKAIIERIVNRVGRRIDTAQPMVDARLPDGSRVNAVIPPLAVKGPCLTIRKFSRERLRMDDLVKCDTISPQVVEFLAACVKDRRSILVAGGTGAGKTTLLNCLASYVSTRERIVCIEDTHELTLDHPHVVFVECRDSNSEGKGRIAVSDLLRNALRQRPDRIIVGECRGDEALDMLQAMNTGHDGSMTTIHANNPADALLRLEVLVRDSGLPSDAIRRQIVSAVDIVVQLVRNEGPSGTRCVSEVTEVVGYDEARQAIQTRTLFRREYQPEVGKQLLFPTGQLPTFANELVRQGHIHLDLFLTGIAHNHG